MSDFRFDLSRLHVAGTEAFSDASEEELRVLVLLVEWGGEADLDKLAAAAGISRARAKSAVVFWREGGVLIPCGKERGNIVDEFDFRVQPDVIDGTSTENTADTIRNADLAGMLAECARMLGKPTLCDADVQNLAGLYEQYALTEDYIITLLSDMLTRSKCTVRTLVNRAIRLHGKGIDTTEKLNAFIHERDERGEWERTLRRIIGAYERRLSDKEITLARKWVELYGYGDEILAYAYDVTVDRTGRCSIGYMDKMLDAWYHAGYHTVDECRAEAGKGNASRTVGKKKKEEKPRYGTFDPEDALRRAIERSYGEDDKDTKGDPV